MEHILKQTSSKVGYDERFYSSEITWKSDITFKNFKIGIIKTPNKLLNTKNNGDKI